MCLRLLEGSTKRERTGLDRIDSYIPREQHLGFGYYLVYKGVVTTPQPYTYESPYQEYTWKANTVTKKVRSKALTYCEKHGVSKGFHLAITKEEARQWAGMTGGVAVRAIVRKKDIVAINREALVCTKCYLLAYRQIEWDLEQIHQKFEESDKRDRKEHR